MDWAGRRKGNLQLNTHCEREKEVGKVNLFVTFTAAYGKRSKLKVSIAIRGLLLVPRLLTLGTIYRNVAGSAWVCD